MVELEVPVVRIQFLLTDNIKNNGVEISGRMQLTWQTGRYTVIFKIMQALNLVDYSDLITFERLEIPFSLIASIAK
jgi:hypothetical protein